MSKINEYISKNYNTMLKKVIYKNNDDDSGDILNDICIYMLTLPEEKTKEWEEKDIENIMYRILNLNVFSSSSPYQHKKNKLKKGLITDIYEDYDFDELKKEKIEFDEKIDNLYSKMDNLLTWYERKILELYCKGEQTFTHISEQTKISKSNLYNTLKIAKNKLKK